MATPNMPSIQKSKRCVLICDKCKKKTKKRFHCNNCDIMLCVHCSHICDDHKAENIDPEQDLVCAEVPDISQEIADIRQDDLDHTQTPVDPACSFPQTIFITVDNLDFAQNDLDFARKLIRQKENSDQKVTIKIDDADFVRNGLKFVRSLIRHKDDSPETAQLAKATVAKAYVHALLCKKNSCKVFACLDIRDRYNHVCDCKVRKCIRCEKFIGLCWSHTSDCKDLDCKIALCRKMKRILSENQKRRSRALSHFIKHGYHRIPICYNNTNL